MPLPMPAPVCKRTRSCFRIGLVLSLGLACLSPPPARAGGYDLPMLHSARQLGMGGSAIGYVSDPSALFHNPAGLGQIGRAAVIGSFSLLLAELRSSPGLQQTDIESQVGAGPLFLLGGGLRLSDWLTVGLGLFPSAMVGASYRYPSGAGAEVENRTRLLFLEGTPAVAVNLPGRVRLGVGYRLTYVNLERYQGTSVALLDFTLDGWNATGFRVGAQWTALDWLQFGAVYRHRITTRVRSDAGIALAMRYTDLETTFVLPSKLGLGGRADWGPLGLALDGEYLFNSQNTAFPFLGVPPPSERDPAPGRTEVPNVFAWRDAITVKTGLEYRLLAAADVPRGRLALRSGYVFDGATTNRRYPSPFATPPGPNHVLTAGAGWRARAWQLNAAYAFLFGEGSVTRADLMGDRQPCPFCGFAGQKPYRLTVHGLYLDLGFAFD